MDNLKIMIANIVIILIIAALTCFMTIGWMNNWVKEHPEDYFNTTETQELIVNQELVPSEEFGGPTPMKIYQIYDRDTGVYYAVTEKGGICVMLTMEGKTKLVDQGDGAMMHPNKGESYAEEF